MSKSEILAALHELQTSFDIHFQARNKLFQQFTTSVDTHFIHLSSSIPSSQPLSSPSYVYPPLPPPSASAAIPSSPTCSFPSPPLQSAIPKYASSSPLSSVAYASRPPPDPQPHPQTKKFPSSVEHNLPPRSGFPWPRIPSPVTAHTKPSLPLPKQPPPLLFSPPAPSAAAAPPSLYPYPELPPDLTPPVATPPPIFPPPIPHPPSPPPIPSPPTDPPPELSPSATHPPSSPPTDVIPTQTTQSPTNFVPLNSVLSPFPQPSSATIDSRPATLPPPTAAPPLLPRTMGDISSLHSSPASFNGKQVMVLVDNGNTYNFIQPSIVKALCLLIREIPSVRIFVGKGDSFVCKYICDGSDVQLCGEPPPETSTPWQLLLCLILCRFSAGIFIKQVVGKVKY